MTLRRRLGRLLAPWLAVAVVLFAIWGWRLVFVGETLAPIHLEGGVAYDIGPLRDINAPAANTLRRALSQGTLPFWDPYRGIGTPFLADPHNGSFSPFTWILLWDSESVGWDVMILLRLLVLGVGCFQLGRRLGLGVLAAGISSVGVLLSGHVVHLQHHFHLSSMAFAPWLLLGLFESIEGSARRGFLLVSATVPLMIFGGGLLDVVLAALACSFMLAVRIFGWGMSRARGAVDTKRLTWLAASGVVAALIAAVFVLPYVELRGVSVPPHEGRAGWTYNTASYYLGTFLSKLLVFTEKPSHWFQFRVIQHVHLLVIPGFLVGVLAASTKRAVTGRWFLLGAALFVGFQDLKTYDFVALRFVENVPILQDVRFEKYNGVRNILLYLVAAVGYTQLASRREPGLRRAGLAALVATALLPVVYVAWFGAGEQDIWSAWLRAAAYSATVAAAALLLIVHHAQSPPQRSGLRALLFVGVMLVALAQWNLESEFLLPQRTGIMRPSLLPGKPLRELLESAPKKRIYLEQAVAGSPREAAGLGFHDVRDFSVVHTRRFHTYFRFHVQKSLEDCRHTFRFCSLHLDGIRISRLDRLGVEQIASGSSDPGPPWELVDRRGRMKLFERVPPTGPLRLTRGYLPWSDEELLERLERDDPDAESASLAFSGDPIPKVLEGDSGVVDGSATVRYTSFNSISFRVEVPETTLVTLRHQHFPGWKAFIDDQPTEIHRVDYFFRGVVVPAGRHVVRMLYRPTSVWVGGLATMLGLLVYLAVAVNGLRRSR